MCYALIGMPIFVLCVASLTGTLTSAFIYVCGRFKAVSKPSMMGKCIAKPRALLKTQRRAQQQACHHEPIGTTLSDKTGKHPMPNGETLKKDYEASCTSTERPASMHHEYLTINKSELGSFVLTKDIEEMTIEYESEEGSEALVEGGEKLIDDESDEGDDDEGDDDEEASGSETQVPTPVAVLVIFGYLGGGVVFFSYVENWTFVQSIYFVYTTITTTVSERKMKCFKTQLKIRKNFNTTQC